MSPNSIRVVPGFALGRHRFRRKEIPASKYTHGHHETVLRSHRRRTAANSAAYLLPHLDPDATLLDIGAGPGTITVDLATRVGHVTATEITATSSTWCYATPEDRQEWGGMWAAAEDGWISIVHGEILIRVPARYPHGL